jgi:hypothetical protein
MLFRAPQTLADHAAIAFPGGDSPVSPWGCLRFALVGTHPMMQTFQSHDIVGTVGLKTCLSVFVSHWPPAVPLEDPAGARRAARELA